MSRRPDGSRRYVRAKGGLPPVSFTILSVSQTAGKASGGTVITVYANGLNGTPTSTLGVVSNVTSTSFQITTSSGSGATAWHATNGNGQVSSTQTFTYLAAPVVSTITPSSGPQTAPNNNSATYSTIGVIFTVSGLPAVGAGVTVSATIDGNALVSLVNNGNGTITATVPADTNSGAVNVVVTVDGVASTGGTGAWTYNPPPVFASVGNVGTNGGTASCFGGNFVSLPTASVNINGTPTSLGVTYVSSTQLTLLLVAGTYTAGSWPLTLTNHDGQTITVGGVFVVTTAQTPETIMGAACVMDLNPALATVSGASIVSVPDVSAGGLNSATIVSASAPQQVVNDSRFIMSPTTMQFTAANSTYLAVPSLSWGGGGTLYFWVVGYVTASETKTLVSYLTTPLMELQTAANEYRLGFNNAPTVTSPLANAGPAVSLGGVIGGSSCSLALNNGPEVDASASNTPGNGDQLTIGARFSGGTYSLSSDFVVARTCAFSAKPTPTQSAALMQWANDTFGVTHDPQYTSSSIVPPGVSGAPLRVLGSNFMPGCEAYVIVSGTPHLCTTEQISTTILDVTTPSLATGTYDLIIANLDGRQITVANAVTVASSTTATATVAFMNIFGLSAVGAYGGENIVLNGLAASGWNDGSGMANNATQATGIDQPVYTASDARFNGKPSITGNGSTSSLKVSSMLLDTPSSLGYTGELWIVAVWLAPTSGVSNNSIVCLSGSESAYLRASNTNAPEFYCQGDQPVWGSAISGAQNVVAGFVVSSATSVNVANGTAVTTGASSQNIYDGANDLEVFTTNGANHGSGTLAFFGVLNATPTGGMLSAWETFCQAYFGTT